MEYVGSASIGFFGTKHGILKNFMMASGSLNAQRTGPFCCERHKFSFLMTARLAFGESVF